MSILRKGAEAAKEASKSAQFARTEYFSLKDGEECILRFITDADEWVTVDQHQFVPTKPEPKGFDGNWPKAMSAVCRYDDALQAADLFDDCFICDFMQRDNGKSYSASGRVWALACLREEVVEDGKVIGIRDKTREVAETNDKGEPTGKTITEKAIVVVNQGYRNFFSTLQGFAGRYGTLLDRDYYIKREGASTDTTYHIVPLDPIDFEGEDGETKRYDLRDDEVAKRYESSLDLEEFVLSRADDKFYGRFFDTRVTVTDDDEVKSSGEAPPKPDHDADEDRVKALADRVRGYSDGGEESGDDESDDESESESSVQPMKAM